LSISVENAAHKIQNKLKAHPTETAYSKLYFSAINGHKYMVATEPNPANKVFIPIVNPF
jgi:hypothetical protein